MGIKLFDTVNGFSLEGVFHGFFGRQGGVSEGVYEGLNCGPGSGDDTDAVDRNRVIVAEAAECLPSHLLSLYQIHSAECLTIDVPFLPENRPKADAFVTDKSGIALGILTADCAPILFAGEKADGSPVIGAAHAGWGGALKGVVRSCVNSMQALGTKPDSIIAAIGPCIAQGSYEVTQDFIAPFLNENPLNIEFFSEGQREGHWQFDLVSYNASKLAEAGIDKIYYHGEDTYADESKYYSYRRKTHRNEDNYGRQISVIKIN